MTKLVRITTVPISLDKLITYQMKFMKSKGFDVIMMSADGPEISKIVDREECEHIVIPLTRKITPIKDLVALYVLIKYFKKIKPHIVHSHTPKAGLIGMIAAWICRIPVRIHTVAGLPLQTAVGAKRRLLIQIEKLTYFFANQVWPNSNSIMDFIKKNKLCAESKLQIIGFGSTNGIDLNEFSKDSLKLEILNEIKRKLNYNQKIKYILFVGRVVKDKGVEELVKGFLELSQNNDTLRLIIVGPFEMDLDPISAEIKNEIENNELIHYIGFSNEVKYYMSIASLFVFPSHREGFPNVIMQAALMDCPVVASKIDGNIDLIDHDINGLLFERGNIDDLKRSIKLILFDEQRSIIYAKELKDKVLSKYNRDYIHNQILLKYNLLINEG